MICPLCGSLKSLTDIGKTPNPVNGPPSKEVSYSVRIYCPDCKKAMTITGLLVVTSEEVGG